MKREYRNKLLTTGALLLGILLYVIVDGFVRYAPENMDVPSTEITEEMDNQ